MSAVMPKRREIRNSTAEFLIFQVEGKEQGIEVYYKDKTVWCTQKAMGMLFDCSSDNIGLNLKNIFASGELGQESVTENISATAHPAHPSPLSVQTPRRTKRTQPRGIRKMQEVSADVSF